MKKSEIGDYLYLFYRKRTTSFLANVYKASVTGSSKDIHRARLDVKKIIAFYEFLSVIFPDSKKKLIYRQLFMPLFKHAGKIREIQVNLLLLSIPNLKIHVPPSFLKWFEEEEHQSTHHFLRAIKRFDEEKLKQAEKVIHKICSRGAFMKSGDKTRKFLRRQVRIISKIMQTEIDDNSLHMIRRHLKIMSTISILVSSIKSSLWLDEIISAVNKTEIMIGEWHDRVVLIESVERFLKVCKNRDTSEIDLLTRLKEELLVQKQRYATGILPEVEKVILTCC